MAEENAKPYAPFQRDPRDPIQGALPAVPAVDETDPGHASIALSNHRTKLSTHRTFLSEHRTGLSEHRTSLAERRSDLAEGRSKLSTRRTDMASRRTGMAFQRTRMSADRTLMGVIRTSLSMISFGFTIYQFFRGLIHSHVLRAETAEAAVFFGTALVYLGVGMIAAGLIYHVQFMLALRRERKEMVESGELLGRSPFPVSFTFVVALLLFLLGVAAILGIVFHLGPFD